MPRTCCVSGCTVRSHDQRGRKIDERSFFGFPTWKQHQGDLMSELTKRRRLAWITAVRRTDLDFNNIPHHFQVCARHFHSGKPAYEMEETNPDWVPSLFLGHSGVRATRLDRHARRIRRMHRRAEGKDDHNVETQGGAAGNEGDPSVADITSKRLKKDEDLVSPSFKDLLAGKKIDEVDLRTQHHQLHHAYTELLAEAERLRAENEKLHDSLQSDFSKLSYRFLKWDQEQLLFLTGLPPVVFDWLVPQIARHAIRVHPEVKPEDHLLIVLMKLKMGLCDDDVGYRFQIDGEIITAICQTWIPALAAVLSPLIEWQSSAAVLKSKPQMFKSKLLKVCCFLDCVEFAIATPKGATKHVKYFVGTTPAGAISFLTLGFSRKVAEKDVICESGFFSLLTASSQILANRTFPIKEDLGKVGVTLHTPADVTRGITVGSPVWDHVKTVLSWWQDFGIFETAVPAPYEEMMDDVVIICAALTNLKMSLVPNVLKTLKRKRKDSV